MPTMTQGNREAAHIAVSGTLTAQPMGGRISPMRLIGFGNAAGFKLRESPATGTTCVEDRDETGDLFRWLDEHGAQRGTLEDLRSI